MPVFAKPNREQRLNSMNRKVPDCLKTHLKILFIGINPGLYSAATGHHFAKPGNRFWPALHLAKLTPRQLKPWEELELLTYGIGITNLVARTTATAAELTKAELLAGSKKLIKKVERYQPRLAVFLGLDAYKLAFAVKKVTVGPLTSKIGATELWVLPNPSGLNAHYQIEEFARLFSQLRARVE